jgi:hypothetical protein
MFSNPKSDAYALNLKRATVSGPLNMKPAKLEGVLNLTAAKTSSYQDDQKLWDDQERGSKKLRLDGFVYDTIRGASAKERLKSMSSSLPPSIAAGIMGMLDAFLSPSSAVVLQKVTPLAKASSPARYGDGSTRQREFYSIYWSVVATAHGGPWGG